MNYRHECLFVLIVLFLAQNSYGQKLQNYQESQPGDSGRYYHPKAGNSIPVVNQEGTEYFQLQPQKIKQYVNIGYIFPAWGIGETAGRLKTKNGISIKIGLIGKKQLGGYVAFTRQVYNVRYDTTVILTQKLHLNYLYSNVTGVEFGVNLLLLRRPEKILGFSLGFSGNYGSSRYLSISDGGVTGGIFVNIKNFNFQFDMQNRKGEGLISVDNGNGYLDAVHDYYSLINYVIGVGYTF